MNNYSQLVVWVGLEDLLCDESFHRLIHLRDQLTLDSARVSLLRWASTKLTSTEFIFSSFWAPEANLFAWPCLIISPA